MSKRCAILIALLIFMLLFSGCSGRQTPDEIQPEQSSAMYARDPDAANIQVQPATPGQEPTPEPTGDIQSNYIDLLVYEAIAQFEEPGMGEYEKVKAAFDYMIETTTLIDPVGLDLWRIRGNADEIPSFVENRSLCVLAYQFGMCEDYAAALTLLLRGMGLEAEYVPGLTFSSQGELVDHAWTVVRVDGTWYHIDPQLEQNISRRGSIRYKYFMRGDGTMSGSHRWGQNLISSGLLTAAQNEEIAQRYTPPACPQDYPTPERRSVTLAQAPDVEAIQAEIAAEFLEYEQANGPLEPLEINTVPPVFGLEGYGPQD